MNSHQNKNKLILSPLTFLQNTAANARTKRTEKIPMRNVQMEERRKHHHFLVRRQSSSLSWSPSDHSMVTTCQVLPGLIQLP